MPPSSLARLLVLSLLSAAWLLLPLPAGASPRSACFRGCHTCQQMYGDSFRGHLCAHTCIKLKGRLVPDCTDLASIAPYIEPANVVS